MRGRAHSITLAFALLGGGCISIAHRPPPPSLSSSSRVSRGAPAGVPGTLREDEGAGTVDGRGEWEARVLVDGASLAQLTNAHASDQVTLPFGRHDVTLDVDRFHTVTTMVAQTTSVAQTQSVPCGTSTCTQTVMVPQTHMVPVTQRVKTGSCSATTSYAAVFEEPMTLAFHIGDGADCAIKDATEKADPFAR